MPQHTTGQCTRRAAKMVSATSGSCTGGWEAWGSLLKLEAFAGTRGGCWEAGSSWFMGLHRLCIGFAVSGRPGSSQLRCQVLVVRKLVSARTAPFGPGPRVQLYMVCNGLLKLGREFRGLAASDRSCGSLRKPRQLSLCTVIARSPHPRWVPQL